MDLRPPPYVRNMWLLLAGRFVSSTMTALFVFAQGLYVMDLTGSAAAFSHVLIAATVPRALLNFVAGVWADRYHRKGLIVGSDLASGLVVLVFLGLFVQNREAVWVFVVLSFLLSGLNTLFVITVQTATAQMVGKDLVMQANAMQQSMKSLIVVLGPMLGALAYVNLGMEVIFLLNAVSFLISALSEMFIRFKAAKPEAGLSMYQNFKMIWGYLTENRPLKTLFYTAIIMQMIFEPMTLLVLPFTAYKILEVSAFQLSLINGLSTVGVVAAAVLITARRKKAWLTRFFFLLSIQGLLFMAWSFPALGWTLSATLVTGIFVFLQILGRFTNTIQNIPLVSHFQVAVPEAIRGRVFGFFFTSAYLLTPLSLWLFSVLLDQIPWWWLPIGSGGLIFIMAWFLGRAQHMRGFFAGL